MKTFARRFATTVVIAASLTTTLAQPASAARRVAREEVIRFLKQATFGPTPTLVDEVQQIGINKYFDQQFSAPMNPYPNLDFWPNSRPDTCVDACRRDNYTYYQLQKHFFTNALMGQDQLRQRVALALSQIVVTSGVDVPMPAWMRSYQQLLYQNAFGNYRQILHDVTLSPAMGRFLDMVNNRCQRRTPHDAEICRSGSVSQPNENYSRELLQLFGLGTFLLNPDGTYRVDAQGNPIPTYDQHIIEEFARVFTGWTLAPELPGPTGVAGTVPNYRDPMVVRVDSSNRELSHDRGEKTLLYGLVIPAGTLAPQEVAIAIDNIANHPNMAPFISKQLIQHLVTSNPTPDYVGRVSKVFRSNLNSPTQLREVVRAILTDREARADTNRRRQRRQSNSLDPDAGKLNEPVLFITNILRAFNATSDGILNPTSVGGSAAMGQDVFFSPSVFNYYPPDYEVPGEENLLGPVFGIFSSRTAMSRINFVNRVIFAGISPAPPDRPLGTAIDLSPWIALAGTPTDLVQQLDCWLSSCMLPPEAETAIANAVAAIPANDPLGRVKNAVYLIVSSSHYQVQR